jgi:hypothetical protein
MIQQGRSFLSMEQAPCQDFAVKLQEIRIQVINQIITHVN